MAAGPFHEIVLYIFLFLLLVGGVANIVVGSLLISNSSALNEARNDLTKGDTDDAATVHIATKVNGILLIVTGCLEIFLACIGCNGMFKRKSGYLKLFGYICCALLIVNIILMIKSAVNFYKSDSLAEDNLNNILKTYDGQDDFNTFYLDNLQVKFSCCGARGRNDYKKSKWYKSTDRQGEVPLSCCKLKNQQRKKDYNVINRKLKLTDLADEKCPTVPSGKPYTGVHCLEKEKKEYKERLKGILTLTVCKVFLMASLAYLALSVAKIM